MKRLGGDVIGQSLRARGLARPRHRRVLRRHLHRRELRRGRRARVGARRARANLPRDDAGLMGRIILDALAALPPDDDPCHCRELRKPTLLT